MQIDVVGGIPDDQDRQEGRAQVLNALCELGADRLSFLLALGERFLCGREIALGVREVALGGRKLALCLLELFACGVELHARGIELFLGLREA